MKQTCLEIRSAKVSKGTNRLQNHLCGSQMVEGLASGSTVKNPPAMQETRVRFLGWEDPLAKGMATHSSILA